MASIAFFFERVKPALDTLLVSSPPSLEDLENLEKELTSFTWVNDIKIVHVLLPLVLKMEDLQGQDQEIRTRVLNCITLVLSKGLLTDVKGLCTVLTIALKQVRDIKEAKMLPNLSEEIKMAVILCITEALQQSISEVLEKLYTTQYASLLGQILLMLVEIIELEKYRKLRIKATECILAVFYVPDMANTSDIVLRRQIADTLFLYLPKILSVLFKSATSDDKHGEMIKSVSIKAMGRILNIMYEEKNDPSGTKCYDSKEFRKLIESSQTLNEEALPSILSGPKIKKDQLKEHFTRMQNTGRSSQWFRETSVRLSGIFKEMTILCSHPSIRIRLEHARMCSLLVENCTENLKENFIILLENLIALSEDAEKSIRVLTSTSLKNLRQHTKNISIFDESADMLFDEHSTKLVQILHQKDELKLYTELLFLKGLVRNIGSKKLYSLLSLSSFMESFCMALVTTADMEAKRELLNEEYALRQIMQADFNECEKFPWRHFKFLESLQCIKTMQDICSILGNTVQANQLLFDYLMDLFQTQQQRMNEILLIMIWMFTLPQSASKEKETKVQIVFVETIMENILNDVHWHLALSPDETARLKVDKPSYWFVDHVPGLSGSGIEMRIQDYDSDDESIGDASERISIADVQQNVLHTCVVLEALGACASSLGVSFKKHVFHCLHKVLLKVASSNTMIYQAAMFCLFSMQKALGYANVSEFIEAHTDYLSYHINTTLRRSPESSSAVDILSVVLQLSSRNSITYLENIFQTIRDECNRAQQEKHISAYLKVFNAFLINVGRWQTECMKDVDNQIEMDDTPMDSGDIFNNWLEILDKPTYSHEDQINLETVEKDAKDIENDMESQENNNTANDNCDTKIELPHHIEIVKGIIQQTIKFISSSSPAHQIQSLECLIVGVPQLKDYENELLPLVHNIWQPLLEKFRQKDPLVLNRCFSLLNILSTHAKDFILQRSLDDVIPYLKYFLKDSAALSAAEHSKTQTQLYKLQSKLLQEFSNLIQTMTIDGKHLNDIGEVVCLYLSERQPKELQNYAVKFFTDLKSFNGPLMYIIALKKMHLKEYKVNVKIIISEYGVVEKY